MTTPHAFYDTLHASLHRILRRVNRRTLHDVAYNESVNLPHPDLLATGRPGARLPVVMYPLIMDVLQRLIGGVINQFHEQDESIATPTIDMAKVVFDDPEVLTVVVKLSWVIDNVHHDARFPLSLPLFPTLRTVVRSDKKGVQWQVWATSREEKPYLHCLMDLGSVLCQLLPPHLVDSGSRETFKAWEYRHPERAGSLHVERTPPVE